MGKLFSTPQKRVSLTERTNKLVDLRTIGGIRDRPPVRQSPRSEDDESSGSDSDSSGSSSSSSEASANPKRQSCKKDIPPSSKHKDYDEYTRLDTGSKARQKLVSTQGMEKYLSDKFTHYVKDKTIQDLVLDSNPLPEVDCLNTPNVDDYLGEIFESK